MENLYDIDWPERQARAAVPFALDAEGLPVNPINDPNLPDGRGNLDHWGEQMCGDALVVGRDADGNPYVLLGLRTDLNVWALPGGKAEEDEDPVDTAIRELYEEAHVRVDRQVDPYVAYPPRAVPDARAGRRSWMVTVLVRFDIDGLPQAVPQLEEFRQVAWAPARSYDALITHLADTYGGELAHAHRPVLKDALDNPDDLF